VVLHRLRKAWRGMAHTSVGLALLGAALVVGQAPAKAATTGFFIEGRQFFSIDVETGDSLAIGDTGVDERFSSLAFSPDGTLYAVADSRFIADIEAPRTEPAELYTIDPSSGRATLVGMLAEEHGIALRLTALTFTNDAVALLTGFASGTLETVFVVDVDGASNGRVPVRRLASDTGFFTAAMDTACDGTVLGLSIAIPDGTPDDGRFLHGFDIVFPEGPVPPMVLTKIDPATGATTEIGQTGLLAFALTIPGLAVDRTTGTTWGTLITGEVFTLDTTTGAADSSAGITAADNASRRKPENLAIVPTACEQPATTTTTTTTTTTSSTTTSTTIGTDEEPERESGPRAPAPPARPATPVTVQPTFTG
jgi:hypothetical protein